MLWSYKHICLTTSEYGILTSKEEQPVYKGQNVWSHNIFYSELSLYFDIFIIRYMDQFPYPGVAEKQVNFEKSATYFTHAKSPER